MRQKGGLPDDGVLRNETNKDMKLLGRGLRTGTTCDVSEQIIIKHVRFILVQIAMETLINYRPVTKVQPFKPTLYKFYYLGLLTYEPNIILGSLRIESLQYSFCCIYLFNFYSLFFEKQIHTRERESERLLLINFQSQKSSNE